MSSQENLENLNMITDPPPDAMGITPTSPSPEVTCQHIRKLQKMVRYADSKVRFQQKNASTSRCSIAETLILYTWNPSLERKAPQNSRLAYTWVS
ncbi:hypothetical protein TNCT_323871 [Trichonephila clavata]|uniref:Uncharacterized protein n=1 Tax=Trichonephila clavata TaxID=2740835 RepID=A0A8X6FMR9_TRICU|nr:hypothetical protein TNCT_323871 [Trichonephila clavata]